jgi:uncharacterized membrane protein
MTAPDVETAGPSPERLAAFSDGVLAIAITLLVLEIKVPEAEEGRLWHELGRLWPSYSAYAVSFLTIGIMWVNHHNLTRRLVAVDHGLVYANIGLLALISFLPFPTAVIAEYLREGGSNETAAVALYGATMVLLSAAFTLMWTYLRRHPILVKPGRTTDLGRQAAKAAGGIAAYVAATALSFASATAALVAFGAIAIAYAFNRLT